MAYKKKSKRTKQPKKKYSAAEKKAYWMGYGLKAAMLPDVSPYDIQRSFKTLKERNSWGAGYDAFKNKEGITSSRR